MTPSDHAEHVAVRRAEEHALRRARIAGVLGLGADTPVCVVVAGQTILGNIVRVTDTHATLRPWGCRSDRRVSIADIESARSDYSGRSRFERGDR